MDERMNIMSSCTYVCKSDTNPTHTNVWQCVHMWTCFVSDQNLSQNNYKHDDWHAADKSEGPHSAQVPSANEIASHAQMHTPHTYTHVHAHTYTYTQSLVCMWWNVQCQREREEERTRAHAHEIQRDRERESKRQRQRDWITGGGVEACGMPTMQQLIFSQQI